MRFQTALVAVTSVTGISAFLIPTEIADAASNAKNALTSLVLGAPQSVDVKCHECPRFIKNTHANAQDGERIDILHDNTPTTIHLDFSTRDGNLQINNETVFPLGAINHQFPKLTAHQTSPNTRDSMVDVPIDFVLSSQRLDRPRHHPHRFTQAKEDDYELITVDFTVIGMGGVPIKSQTAHADLILHDGVYSLGRLYAAEFNPTAPGEDDLEVCKAARNVQLCRVKLVANRKLREMMQGALARAKHVKEWMRTHGPGNKPLPCHKFRPGRIGTVMNGGHRGQHGQHGEHGQHNQHGHHGHHGKHGQHGHKFCPHRFLRIATAIIKGLVVPAIVGFIFGFTVSAVGMLVGRLIVFLWTRLYRGHRGPVRSHNEVALEDGEKEGLMAETEEPPAYEYRDEVPVSEAEKE